MPPPAVMFPSGYMYMEYSLYDEDGLGDPHTPSRRSAAGRAHLGDPYPILLSEHALSINDAVDDLHAHHRIRRIQNSSRFFCSFLPSSGLERLRNSVCVVQFRQLVRRVCGRLAGGHRICTASAVWVWVWVWILFPIRCVGRVCPHVCGRPG